MIIRPKSLLGLKYVEITRGESDDGYAAGRHRARLGVAAAAGRVRRARSTRSTAKTREGIRDSTLGFGTALAGRGESINTAIAAFRPLLTDLEPVARYLADPETDLTGFIRALGQSAAEVAPVADAQAQLFVGAARTFGALAEVARPFIQDTIAEGPETLDTAVESFRVQRPFLREHRRALMADLRPGVNALRRRGARPLGRPATSARPVLRRTPAFDRRLEDLLISLEDFAHGRRGARAASPT